MRLGEFLGIASELVAALVLAGCVDRNRPAAAARPSQVAEALQRKPAVTGPGPGTAHSADAAPSFASPDGPKGHDHCAEEITELVFSPDGATLAAAALEGCVRVYDVRGGKELARWRTASRLWQVVWIGANRALGTVLGDGAVVWDSTTGRILRRFGADPGATVRSVPNPDDDASPWRRPKGPLETLRFSPDGSAIAIVSGEPERSDSSAAPLDENSLAIYDPLTGERRRVIRNVEHESSIVGWSMDGSAIATRSNDGVTTVLDASNGSILGTCVRCRGKTVRLSRDGRTLVGIDITARPPVMEIIDTVTERVRARVAGWRVPSPSGQSAWVNPAPVDMAVAWSPDAKLAIVQSLEPPLTHPGAAYTKLFETVRWSSVRSFGKVGIVRGNGSPEMGGAAITLWNPAAPLMITLDDASYVITRVRADGVEPVVLRKSAELRTSLHLSPERLVWSPDGGRLAGAAETATYPLRRMVVLYDGQLRELWSAL